MFLFVTVCYITRPIPHRPSTHVSLELRAIKILYKVRSFFTLQVGWSLYVLFLLCNFFVLFYSRVFFVCDLTFCIFKNSCWAVENKGLTILVEEEVRSVAYEYHCCCWFSYNNNNYSKSDTNKSSKGCVAFEKTTTINNYLQRNFNENPNVH